MRLRAPADPRLAVTVRTFVASSSRFLGLDPDLCEDLRLAANELFAAAADGDAGAPSLEVRIEGGPDDATLTAVGVPDLTGPGDLPVSRRDLLAALFPDLRQHDRTVVIRAAPGRS